MMPVHDWTKVAPGTFHNFHLQWQAAMTAALNSGMLPDGYFAMVEQRADGPIPGVLAIELPPPPEPIVSEPGGLAVATAPPKARFVVKSDPAIYAQKARRIAVRDNWGEVVTIIEIVSPGNKDTPNSIRSFSKKMAGYLRSGINLVVVDVFPPTARDPQGIHKAIWDIIEDDPFELPADQQLTAAGYNADDLTGYIEPFAVGGVLPDVPLFLKHGRYVPCPLESSYQTTWSVMPAPIRHLLEPR